VAHTLASGPGSTAGAAGGTDGVEFLYLGGPRALDRRLVEEAGLPFRPIEVGGLRGMGLDALKNAARMPRALAQVLRVMRSFDPHVVLISGGSVSARVAAAAVLLRVPLVVLTVEIDQGWVNMAAARVAAAVTASFPPAMPHLPPDRTVLTGYPVRDEFLHLDRAAARARLQLDPAVPVLCVFGGSLGARRINDALSAVLPDVVEHAQVLHVCGEPDLPVLQARRESLLEAQRERYRLRSYLPAAEMASMLASADLAVCRAGAAPLAELPLAGTPAILVPGPFSSQTTNATYLREQGAALVIADADLTAETLREQVLAVLQDRERLASMAEAMRSLARPDAAAQIATLVRRIAAVGRL
jgi:UDP-N-acetylglucosamine--N-acetylmuramyl-(pentapeptide) pyrophosphoryl-undecaprenol N-acetylglucosamine transferase